LLKESLENVFELFSFTHKGNRQSKTPTFANHVNRRIRMEMTGTTFGLTPVNLVGIFERFPMIRDQDQIDSQGLGTAAQTTRQTVGEGAVDPALQFVDVGQGSRQGIPDGLVGGGLEQGRAGGGQGGDAGGGIEEDGKQDVGAALRTVVAQFEVFLADVSCVQLDIAGCDGILTTTHSFLQS
jgi:hypothetical protein